MGIFMLLGLKARTHGATLRATLRQLENCTVCPTLKRLRATFPATVAEEESAPTSATLRATVSPCVHHLQHCVQQCCKG